MRSAFRVRPSTQDIDGTKLPRKNVSPDPTIRRLASGFRVVANDLSPERTDATAIESESIGGFRASAELGGFYERSWADFSREDSTRPGGLT